MQACTPRILDFVCKVHTCICRVHVRRYMYLLEDKEIILKLICRPKIVIMHGYLSPGVTVRERLSSHSCSVKPETSYWLKMS